MMKVSVIMATYNGSAFLQQQLNSIYRQTHQKISLIVSDDGSTDETLKILQREASSGKLSLVNDNSHLGIVGNFKRAASFAGDYRYLAFADQDDIWDRSKIELSIKAIQCIERLNNPALVYSDLQVIDTNNRVVHQSLWDLTGYKSYTHALPTVLFGCIVNGCTMLINSTLAKEIANMPDDCMMHDAWLTLYAFSFGVTGIVNAPVISYRQHQSNVTYDASVKPLSRFQKLIDQVRKWILGKDDLFQHQFPFVEQFYETYESKMNHMVKAEFNRFLSLKNASYFQKKIAFRRAMKRAVNFPSVF